LHYWGGGAAGVFAEAQNGGIVAAAEQNGFIIVVPQNPDCWDRRSLGCRLAARGLQLRIPRRNAATSLVPPIRDKWLLGGVGLRRRREQRHHADSVVRTFAAPIAVGLELTIVGIVALQ
jgi:hypothetical protein